MSEVTLKSWDNEEQFYKTFAYVEDQNKLEV